MLFLYRNSFGTAKTEIIINICLNNYSTIKWDTTSIVTADINFDKKQDYAILGYKDKLLCLMVIFGDLTIKSKFQTSFLGIGESSFQDHICGETAKLTLESLDTEPSQEIGYIPEGFKCSKTSKGLNISDDDCDSFHYYWNHKIDALSYWRL